jgi:uncharacterized protein YyaL (SSP411 family)
MANRLAGESSPYLRQHANNPVDWYPWGDEAFQRAREEDRPILLSIGYSACHWCHVMEHESFEDEATAQLMNERFVNIKVDREERPDVDSLYMTAVQALTGRGGWPMTVFLTPQGAPFYGGTYFPPVARHGLPAFQDVLLAIDEAYRERREDVGRSAAQLVEALEQSTRLRAPVRELPTTLLDEAYRGMEGTFDLRHGGFGAAPKFPQPMALEFMLRHHLRTGQRDSLDMVHQTLREMARGGMYDQVGGGFHRYSVDAQWLVPHFEKMLYDNALLAQLYLRAHQVTGDDEFRRVAEEVLRWVTREMTSPQGAFYSAQDADSEGEEGRFYVWTPAQIEEVLGPQDGALFCSHYGVTEDGNFEGSSILHVRRDVTASAAAAGIPAERLEAILATGRDALYQARALRVPPGLDDKVLTSWNAMMLQAFAVAAQVTGRDEYVNTAVRNAEFLLRELQPAGRLQRTWRDGRAKIDAFLEDHALLADSLLSLYETTFDPRWIREARRLADTLIDEFWEPQEGFFYDGRRKGEALVVRPRSVDDNATPSGNSAATGLLLRLAALTGESRYRDIASRVLQSMAGLLRRAPLGFGRLLAALDFHLAAPREVAIAGDPAAADTRALLSVYRERFRPNSILAVTPADPPADLAELVPLLEGRVPVDGRAAAYVCERFTCQRPVTEPDALRSALEQARP